MAKEQIIDNLKFFGKEFSSITQLRETLWKGIHRGLTIALPRGNPMWEEFPEYKSELKNLFAILPRHIFAGNFANFQFETKSLDEKLKTKWNTGFYNWDRSVMSELVKIHFLIERHCFLPLIDSLKGKMTKTIILGSQEQIAKSICLPNAQEQIYEALSLFALGNNQLRMELGRKFSQSCFTLYDFSFFEGPKDVDKVPNFFKDNNCFYLNFKSPYLDMMSQLPLSVSEYAAVKSYPVYSQRWLELITHWRKEKIRQGSKENEFFIDYKTLCQWMPMGETDDKDSIIRQLEHLHRPYFANGLLADFSLTPPKEKLTNWILKYQFNAE